MANDHAADIIPYGGAVLSEVLEASASTTTPCPPPSRSGLTNPDQA
jgi:hypothetical protein